MVIVRQDTQSKRFIARPHSDMDHNTARMFQELQTYLQSLEARLEPLFGGAVLDGVPLALTEPAWILMSFTTPVGQVPMPTDVGVYSFSLRMGITGEHPASWVQLRMTWDDAEGNPQEIEGDQVDVGASLQSVTLVGTVATGFNLQFWIRGDRASVSQGRITAQRIGSGP